MKIALGIVLTAVVALGAALPQDKKPETAPAQKAPAPAATAPTDAEIIRAQKPAYPLTTCPESGHKLDEKAIDVVVDARLVRLCCADCKGAADKNKAAWIAKVDEAVVAAQKPAYPMTTCPVSGLKLDAKGAPVDFVQGTKLVRLCCDGCKKAVTLDPAKALAQVDKAWIAAQAPTYPLTTCPVSDEKLGTMGEPVDVLYGTKLVRLCCSSCKKALDKDGAAVVAKVEAAAKQKK